MKCGVTRGRAQYGNPAHLANTVSSDLLHDQLAGSRLRQLALSRLVRCLLLGRRLGWVVFPFSFLPSQSFKRLLPQTGRLAALVIPQVFRARVVLFGSPEKQHRREREPGTPKRHRRTCPTDSRMARAPHDRVPKDREPQEQRGDSVKPKVIVPTQRQLYRCPSVITGHCPCRQIMPVRSLLASVDRVRDRCYQKPVGLGCLRTIL